MKATKEIKTRLEELRTELRGECISYGELAELASLAEFIEEDDVELLQAAGVPEKFDLKIRNIKKDLVSLQYVIIKEIINN